MTLEEKLNAIAGQTNVSNQEILETARAVHGDKVGDMCTFMLETGLLLRTAVGLRMMAVHPVAGELAFDGIERRTINLLGMYFQKVGVTDEESRICSDVVDQLMKRVIASETKAVEELGRG